MPATRLPFSVRAIDALPFSTTNTPDKYKDDGSPKSQRELYLHIGRTSKVFYFVRKINGRTVRHRLGTFPNVTIETARGRCKELAGDAERGINPLDKKRQQRSKGLTFREAFEQYLNHATTRAKKPIKASTITNYRRSMDTHFPKWLSKPCTEIKKGDVKAWYDKAAKQSPSSANSALSVGRAVFAHQINISLDQQSDAFVHDPFVNHATVEVGRRTECIELTELPAWFKACNRLQNKTTRDYLKILLLTGLRRRELASIQFDDIDFRKKILTVSDTKNGTPHTIPLSTYVLEILEQRRVTADSKNVFASTGKLGYIAEPKKAVVSIERQCGVRCSPHGLRRTFASIAANHANVPPVLLKQFLNHAPAKNDVTEYHYITALPLEQQRPHMQAINDSIMGAANQSKPLATVIELGR